MSSASDFYKEWMENENWWFHASANDDEYIRDKWEHLLDAVSEPSEDMTLIARIIIHDQLVRHVLRQQIANHVISYHLQLAIQLSDELLRDGGDNLDTKDWVFALLPLRHTNDSRTIHKVMSLAWQRLSADPDDQLVRRFLRATYERCPKEQSIDLFVRATNHEIACAGVWCTDRHCDVIEPASYSFLQPQLQLGLAAPFVKAFDTIGIHTKSEQDPVIVSFSGGVDSMVALTVLAHQPRMQGKLVAVHINYANRETADKESAFVKDWCRYLNVPLYSRRISEINRPTCMKYEMRDLYESYTRDVRYGTYKAVWRHHFGGAAGAEPRVIMGHNQDDCVENMLTNIAQQRSYDNLKGMAPVSRQDGICFLRPFLDVPKKDIIAFAHSCYIPHLPNSTPSWCQRGMIREKVRPTLAEWEPGFVQGLEFMCQHMQDLHAVYDNALQEVLSATKKLPRAAGGDTYTFEVSTTNPIIKQRFFWRKYIQELTGVTISMKSIDNFLQGLHRTKSSVPLSKSVVIETIGYTKYTASFYCFTIQYASIASLPTV